MNEIAVVGIGNVLFKDEGLGIHAVRLIKDEGIDIIEAGTPGFGLLDIVKNYKKVIILDAVDMGKPAGTIGRFSPEQVVSISKGFSLHEMGLAEVIKLGTAIGEDFSNVIIFGIQPQDISFGEGLSEAVKKNIPNLIEEVTHGAGYAGNA